MQPELVLDVTCRLLGAWAILTGAGWMVDAPRWATGGPLGRDLQRLRRSRLIQWRTFDILHASRGLALLGASRAALGLWLVLLPGHALIALVALGLVGAVQAVHGSNDGADKVAMMVIAGGVLQAAGLAFNQPTLTLAGVLWIGGQLTLAYATSGWAKLRHGIWRDGTAIQSVLSTYMYGCGWAARAVRPNAAAKFLAWSVIGLEVLFPLALLLASGWLAAVLGLFLIFHLAIAAAMGLNTYPLAFAATYPSTLVLGQWLRFQLGLG